ncbi:hypothetical protein SAY87_005387 [Trapa incisa]|uniref:K-box domain-containing protein n=1 Tax=Trapa incisa TaxID=236973 RepID=A0AAN7K614_9MYRT|nr:hypothetical protein SAY87_005387 [Trapa incisa]
MLETLERYQKCNYGAPESNTVSAQAALELISQQEYLKLKARYEALQRTQRNLMGEDLGPLSSKELESPEKQLDASLKQIRSTLMRQQKQKTTSTHGHFLQLAHESHYGTQHQPPGDAFFHALECEPTLQIAAVSVYILKTDTTAARWQVSARSSIHANISSRSFYTDQLRLSSSSLPWGYKTQHPDFHFSLLPISAPRGFHSARSPTVSRFSTPPTPESWILSSGKDEVGAVGGPAIQVPARAVGRSSKPHTVISDADLILRRGLPDRFARSEPFLVKDPEVFTAVAGFHSGWICLALARSFDGDDALWFDYLLHRVHADALGDWTRYRAVLGRNIIFPDCSPPIPSWLLRRSA